jgi:lipoyl(octanoyl) transferase
MALKLCFRQPKVSEQAIAPILRSSMRWHFRLDAPADGATNMAWDEALLKRAERTGESVFRLYGWASPTLSLGSNQVARGCYDEDAARTLGISFVRRPTGGRALLHHREVTYSATMPLEARDRPRAAYDFINEVLLAGLARLGVGAERAAATVGAAPGLRPCFDLPSEHEIVVEGRKLVGSAQVRRGRALLQHGSILIHDDQPTIGRLMRTELEAPPPAATLADALGREPSIDEVVEPLLKSLESAVHQPIGTLCPDAQLEDDFAHLRRTYASDAWTWRR